MKYNALVAIICILVFVVTMLIYTNSLAIESRDEIQAYAGRIEALEQRKPLTQKQIELVSYEHIVEVEPLPVDDLRKPSGLTAKDFDTYLQGTALEGHGKDFEAIDSYINGAFVCAVAVHESGWGTSDLAKYKNNLFGYGAYDESLESAWKFRDWSSCIRSVAVYMLRDYLTEGGEFYNGYTVESIGQRYATDVEWAECVKEIMAEIEGVTK